MELKPSENNNEAIDLKQTLSQAEEEHWLDCPNAPLALRLASFVLDCILIYLFLHGTHRLIQALALHSPQWESRFPIIFNTFFLGFLDVFLRLSFLFFYLIVSVSEFGATIGKLLLGIKVVDSKTGKALSYGQSSLRLLFAITTNLLSLAVGMSRPDKKYLHDILSKSTVKRVRGKS